MLPLLRCLLVGAVGEGSGELPHVEVAVIHHHKEQAQEEGGEDSNEDPSPVPAVYVVLLPERPQSDEEDILYQHDRVKGENLELGILFLKVEVAEYVDVGHKETQEQLVGCCQSFALNYTKINPNAFIRSILAYLWIFNV